MDQNTKDVLMVVIPAATGVVTSFLGVLIVLLRRKLEKVARDVNGHTDLLVQATTRAAHSAGKEEERIERRGRDEVRGSEERDDR